MAKIQNIYAIASDGTKIPVTASAVGAVPTDQVATSSVLGLIKTGDNTIQGQENGTDVSYLEVNASGKGFVPAFDITKYFEKYAIKGEYKVYIADVYNTDSSTGTTTLITKIYSDSEIFNNTTNSKGIEWHNAAHIWYIKTGSLSDTTVSEIVACQLGTTDTNGNYVLSIDNVYTSDTLSIDLSNPSDNIIIRTYAPLEYDHFFEVERVLDKYSLGLYFNLEQTSGVVDVGGGYTVTGENFGGEWYFWHNTIGGNTNLWCPWFDESCSEIDEVFGNATGIDYPSVNGGSYIVWKKEAQSGTKTPNRVVLDATDPNIGIVDIDTFQHASTTQYGIVQYPANYYYDDGTPKIATIEYAGVVKIDKDYTEYTPVGSLYAAALLTDEDGVGYVNVFPATTKSIGSIMVSDSSTYDTSTISNKTIAWVNLNGNRAFVYVNLATQQYRGSVRVQSKYTAYTTLDSQTAAYLRITDAGYGYVTVLPATSSQIGSLKVASKQTEYISTDGNWCAPLEIASTNIGFVRVFPATSSIIGSVGVVDKYTAYSTEDSQTAAYLRINSAGKAYTPMLTETWQFTVLNDDDTETIVDKNVVLG